MKILVDMNLSPAWVPVLERRGFSALHWSAVGDPTAPDSFVLRWARENEYVLFTNDLDFGALLAIARAVAPSVIQVRGHDVTPEHLADVVATALRQHEAMLREGAFITVDEARSRSRILPLVR